MSSNQQSDGGQVPSWDEFNMAHEEDPGGGGNNDANGNNDDPLDIDDGDQIDERVEEDDEEEVNEPGGQPEECGPSLPPGFGGDESQHSGEHQQSAANDLLTDFSIPIENYKLDDPEDPLQCTSSSSTSNSQQRHAIGPQLPSSLLPKIGRTDEHLLPSIGNAAIDFIPGDHLPINGGPAAVIGPTLPPDLNPLTPSTSSSIPVDQSRTTFPNMDDLDDVGPAMPPDEPQCSSSTPSIGPSIPTQSSNDHFCEPIIIPPSQQKNDEPPPQNHRRPQIRPRSQERHIGPTLPSSSDEEEGNDDEDEVEDEGREMQNGRNKIGQNEEEDEEEMVIGPMPPAPGKSDEEETAEYLARLAQFEANKQAKASNGLKREEWMTELPQKMLKTGAFGLSAKTSFSRSTAGPSNSADTSAWTNVPNGNGQKNDNGPGPSTSSAGKALKAAAAAKPPKRSEQDEWEEQRAKQLNEGRNESLLDIHQKKRKLDSANAQSLIKTASGERRPFNRDTDMEVRGLGQNASDPAALKERVGELSGRFGHSSDKKFL